jgi:hypothetical protein
MEQGKVIHTKIVGVSYGSRQSIIEDIHPGDTIRLTREPDNPNDRNAVSVYWNDQQIGYLDHNLAREVGPGMDRAKISGLPGMVAQVTGGEGGYLRGVNISFLLPIEAVKPLQPAWLVGLLFGVGSACLGASAPSVSGFNERVMYFITNLIIWWLISTLMIYLFRTRPKVFVVALIGLLSSCLILYGVLFPGTITQIIQWAAGAQPTASRSAGTTGWSTNTPIPTQNPFLTAQVRPGNWQCAATDNVSVRTQPSLDATEKAVLNLGDCIEIIGKNPDGTYLKTTQGWVWAASLSRTGKNYSTYSGPVVPAAQATAVKSISGYFPAPTFAELVVTSSSSHTSNWDQTAAFHTRNLAIPEPYEWEFFTAIRTTRYQNVKDYYQAMLVGMGYRMTFNEQGMNDIYLLKFKQDNQVVTIQFWAATAKDDPSFMIFYQGF